MSDGSLFMQQVIMLAHERILLPWEELQKHIGAEEGLDIENFFDVLRAFGGDAEHHIDELAAARGFVKDSEEWDAFTGAMIASALFLLGRAFEETGVLTLADDGKLNHFCTECSGRKPKP